MKKISLILLGVFGLLFSTNVYAVRDTPGTYYVPPFDTWRTSSSFYQVTYDNESLNFSNGIEWTRYYYTYYTNETGFGHYSDGSIIPYYRPTTSFPSYFLKFPEFYRETSLYEVDGNFYTSIDISNARRTDFSANLFCDGNGNCPNTININSFRLDFTIRLDFVSVSNGTATAVNNSITKNIFEGVTLDWVNKNFTTCSAVYNDKIYTIDVSCRGPLVPNFTFSLIYNNVKDYTVFDDSNYHIFMLPSFTQGTLVVIAGDRYEELVTNMSPSGDTFDSTYSAVEINSDNYFSNFGDLNLNGLTEIVLSPLAFIRSLSTSSFDTIYRPRVNPYSCARDPLAVVPMLFGHQICIPSGAILWNRGDLKSGSAFVSNFRIFWNTVFGGYIIYLLCMKLYKVSIRSFDPDSEDEVTTL